MSEEKKSPTSPFRAGSCALLNWDNQSVLVPNQKLKFPIDFQFFINCQNTFGFPIELSELQMIRPLNYCVAR